MRADKFTQKTSEALEEAQRLVATMGQQAVELCHLALALVTQTGGWLSPCWTGSGWSGPWWRRS